MTPQEAAPIRPLAKFTRARRRQAVTLIKQSGVLQMAPGAQILYAVGCLVADDHGHLPEADLNRALSDPSIVQAAQELLRKAVA